jgi:hypothetical protein
MFIGKTIARKRMQDKYISQIFELYEDFNVSTTLLTVSNVSSSVAFKFSGNSDASARQRGQRCSFSRIFLRTPSQPKPISIVLITSTCRNRALVNE